MPSEPLQSPKKLSAQLNELAGWMCQSNPQKWDTWSINEKMTGIHIYIYINTEMANLHMKNQGWETNISQFWFHLVMTSHFITEVCETNQLRVNGPVSHLPEIHGTFIHQFITGWWLTYPSGNPWQNILIYGLMWICMDSYGNIYGNIYGNMW